MHLSYHFQGLNNYLQIFALEFETPALMTMLAWHNAATQCWKGGSRSLARSLARTHARTHARRPGNWNTVSFPLSSELLPAASSFHLTQCAKHHSKYFKLEHTILQTYFLLVSLSNLVTLQQKVEWLSHDCGFFFFFCQFCSYCVRQRAALPMSSVFPGLYGILVQSIRPKFTMPRMIFNSKWAWNSSKALIMKNTMVK